jgi:hypothetical protein
MKTLVTTLAMTLAGLGPFAAHATNDTAPIHRYLVERTFPPGALAKADAAAKQKINATNRTQNVTWVKSYMNHDQTKTYCIYQGPSEQAVRDVAKLTGLPVDNVTAIPGELKAEPAGGDMAALGHQRYLVKRTGAVPAPTARDALYGAKLLTAYAMAGQTSYAVYEAKSLTAVAQAAGARGVRVEEIVEIPQTLMPY